MWTHPLNGLGDSGDFDVENIVDAREDFGAEDYADYADYVEVGGDFGTLGQSYGDDGMGGIGRKLRRAVKKVAPKAVTKAVSKVSAPVAKLVSPIASPIAKVVSAPVAAITTKAVPSPVQKVMPSVGRKLGLSKLGAKIQAGIQHKKDEALRKITGSTTSKAVTVVPVAAKAPEAVLQPHDYEADAQEVVSTGGQISEQKLSKGVKVVARNQFSHPLVGMGELPDGLMGDDGMGLSLSDITATLKKKAAEEAAKLKAKLAADAKARLAQATGNISSSLFNKPEVQAAIQDQAKQATASTLAEKMLDPAVQKKAAIGLGVAAAVAAGLVYAAMKNK